MNELLELLTAVRDDVDFESCDELIDSGLLDSFDIIQIVTAINEKYEIEIPATQIISKNFNSVTAMLDMINKLVEY